MLEKLQACTKCKLSETRRSVCIPSFSQPIKKGMIVTDCPTKKEDVSGSYTDAHWRIIDKVLSETNDSISNYYITSAIKCIPESNRYPNDNELTNCSEYLIQEVALVQPKVILVLSEQIAKVFMPQEKEILVNKMYQSRFAKVVLVSHNIKSIREGTDKFNEFKMSVKKFVLFAGKE